MPAKAGKNSQGFLYIVNSHGQRSTAGSTSYRALSDRVHKMLPEAILFEDGSSAKFPHFFVTDASQNACKAMQVYQTYLTGAWGGKNRGEEPPEPRRTKVKKAHLKKRN